MTDPRTLTEGEAVEFTGRIAGLARSSLPLGPGLIALGEELPPGALRQSIIELARAMEAGVSLEDAIRAQEDRLPPQIRGLVQAGLRTGRLGELLGRFSGYAAVGTELRRKLRLNLAYPIISVTVALGILAFVCTALVPQYETIMADFGLPLPRITSFLIQVSHVFNRMWPAILTLLIVLVAAWIAGFFLATPQRRSIAGRLPIIGAVWHSTSLAEFFHLLALLLEGEVPMSQAVRLAGDGVGNASLLRAGERVALEVEAGRGLADSMAAVDDFPQGVTHLLKWSEKPGSLPEVLHMVGEMLEARARAQLTFVASFASLLSIIFIVCGAVVVIIGLMLPMITLISKLTG